MDCEHCNRKNPEMVTRYAMEELAARQDIANRRQHVIIILLICLLVASWIGFFIYQSQFETVSTTEEIQQEVDQDADSGGYNNFVGGDIYGTSENQTND